MRSNKEHVPMDIRDQVEYMLDKIEKEPDREKMLKTILTLVTYVWLGKRF